MSIYANLISEAKKIINALSGLDRQLIPDIEKITALSEYFAGLMSSVDAVEFFRHVELNQSRDIASLEEVYIAAPMLQLSLLDNESFDEALRKIRKFEMCRIIFRDLTRLANLVETTRDLSALADFCIAAALEYHYQKNIERFGIPSSEGGIKQEMCVLALGKLGANELNLSSDIDIIFFYDQSGFVDGLKEMSNQEFFLRTARQVIKSLDEVKPSGFVFRVDMRLRPYGESSPVVTNRNVLEKYYIKEGRDWERYAFVKARAAAGNLALGFDFLAWLKPFVYRKHLDFGAIESLRDMKDLINKEVIRRDLKDDIKLGPGGIREVEFVTQALQLVWGGKLKGLQGQRLFHGLKVIEEEKLLPVAEVMALRQAYIYLRNSEHVLQGEKDQQTQLLPSNAVSQIRLAIAMGETSYQDYITILSVHRDKVSACFQGFMARSSSEEESKNIWLDVWEAPLAADNMETLTRHGFSSHRAAEKLAAFRKQQAVIQNIALNRLHRLMPIVLFLCVLEDRPDETLDRILLVLEAVTRRSTYLAFLLENEDATKRLVLLCAMSPWVSAQVSKMPILLYELTDKKIESQDLDIKLLHEKLDVSIEALAEDDLEGQMDVLRQFKHAAVLNTAILELLDILPTMKASDYLTHIAELVIDKACTLASAQLRARFGCPCDRKGVEQDSALSVIAYGKLGGIELAYGSDLDIVFLHNVDIQGETNGLKSVPNNVFFSRLAQRIVHILSSLTQFGLLYEVDLRLRPNGNKGPLVSTVNAYRDYLLTKAWTWEHQALVRARFVKGSCEQKMAFAEIRREVLTQARDRTVLRKEVRDMRERMRVHNPKHVTELDYGLSTFGLNENDLKYGSGAIVDIEFMVQYFVLANAFKYPALTEWTDKVRLIELLATNALLSSTESSDLHQAYITYRSVVHYVWLGGKLAPKHDLNNYREAVIKVWHKYLQVQD